MPFSAVLQMKESKCHRATLKQQSEPNYVHRINPCLLILLVITQ